MLLLYTFCCDIGKHSKDDLIKIFKILMKSIKKNIPEYKLICFSNFKKKLLKEKKLKKYNIEYRKYYDNKKYKLYDNKWLNLSFNKINIYKDLYDEFNKDFIWIDIDTIICKDISYINNIPNVFIENGGNSLNKKILFHNNNTITIPFNKYIQGNFWKLDINLYNNLMNTLDKIIEKKLQLRYDLQDLFNYYIYIENNGDYEKININILGNNIEKNSINGLGVWSKEGNTHPTKSGLKNLYRNNGILKSKFYPEKNIHILSFTFDRLKKFYHLKKFKKIFKKTLLY